MAKCQFCFGGGGNGVGGILFFFFLVWFVLFTTAYMISLIFLRLVGISSTTGLLGWRAIGGIGKAGKVELLHCT